MPALLRTLRGIALGLAGAALAPALLAWILTSALAVAAKGDLTLAAMAAAIADAFLFAVPALVVAAAHAMILGLPAFIVVRKFGKASWLTSVIAGFLIGFVPFAILSFPRPRPGWSSGGWMWGEVRRFYVDGMPTLWEWISYGQSAGLFGLFGLTGGLAFWIVWRRYGSQVSSSG